MEGDQEAAVAETESGPSAPRTAAVKRMAKKTKKWLFQNLLPVSLICAVAFGAAWPTPGVAVGTKVDGNSPLEIILVVVIFFISGLKLTTAALRKAITAVAGIAFGLLSIMFVTVVVGVKLTQEIPFKISEFQSGLVVFFSMPTTINSGIVLTQQANGNYALAVLLTVVTNTLAVFTIPPMLAWLADFSGVSLDIGDLMLKLVLRVLVPLIVGKLMQNIPAVPPWVKRHGLFLKLVSIYALVALPWILTSRAMDDNKFDDVSAENIFKLLGWSIAMHFIFLFMNFGSCFAMRSAHIMDETELRAVVILASQKTLPVAIAVIQSLPDSVGDGGLMSIACILAHLSQIVIDGFFISALWSDDPEAKKDEKKASDAGDGSTDDGIVLSQTHDEDDAAVLVPRDGVVYTVDVANSSTRPLSDVSVDTGVDAEPTGTPSPKKFSVLSTGPVWPADGDYEEGSGHVAMVPMPHARSSGSPSKDTYRRTSIV